MFEIRYARMPEDRPAAMQMDTGGSVANTGVSGICDQSSAASDSGSETGPVTESLRERRLRELQLQVSADFCTTQRLFAVLCVCVCVCVCAIVNFVILFVSIVLVTLVTINLSFLTSQVFWLDTQKIIL